METKINLQLGTEYAPGELNTAVITCLSCECLLDLLKATIRKYNKEYDMVDYMDKFSALQDDSYDVSFTSMSSWIDYKSRTFNSILKMVKEIDDYLTSNKVIESGRVCADIQSKLNEFILSLATINVDSDVANFGDANIDKDYIARTIDQLKLVNEGVILSSISSMELEFTPLEVESNRNSIVEEKLKKINSIAKSCENTFNSKYDELLSMITNMYAKFYEIAFASLTDGEKAEKARKLIKCINPHKQLLDKLEDKLTEANELKRQLTIHDKRLSENLGVQKATIEEKINANPSQWEMYERDLDSVEYMTQKYSEDILRAIDRVNSIEKKISEHYKTLDKIENAFKTAIPVEDEMKKYTSIGFKFQDLCVRLELAKSQINKGDKDMLTAVNTAITGLSTLIAISTDVKELYLRNAMVTATFKAVNAIYSFDGDSNEAVAVSQMKFLTDKLNAYNDLYSSFVADSLTYRKVGNNTIRDVSMIMGKPLGLKGVLDIVDEVDLSIKQINSLFETLDKNNRQQIEILKAILDR